MKGNYRYLILGIGSIALAYVLVIAYKKYISDKLDGENEEEE